MFIKRLLAAGRVAQRGSILKQLCHVCLFDD
jgi:hypothetical protein